MVTTMDMPDCKTCDGKGKMPDGHTCKTCGGTGKAGY
jgi:DnaJ-class molecular chaperone